MKIIIFSSDNNKVSGAFLCMAKLAEILAKKYGHEILVVLPRKGDGKKILDKCGVNSILIRSYSWVIESDKKDKLLTKVSCLIKGCLNFVAIQRVSKLIIDEGADIVHVNTLWTYVGARAALKTNTPLIWHAREFLEEDQGVQIGNKEKGYKLLGKATHAIVISKSVYEKYAPIFGKNKMSLIYDGIDPDRFITYEHQIFESSIHQILIMGNIRKEKGQDIAIKACIKLHDSGERNFLLKIAGTGNERYIDELKHYVREHNASNYIMFCGGTDEPEKFFKAADVTLMCSGKEPFGRVTVEAMMSASLVIASDSAGSSEIVEHKKTGLMFKCGDADDLASELSYAFSHVEEMRGIARDGRKHAMECFTAERNAEEINTIYRKILNEDDTMLRFGGKGSGLF